MGKWILFANLYGYFVWNDQKRFLENHLIYFINFFEYVSNKILSASIESRYTQYDCNAVVSHWKIDPEIYVGYAAMYAHHVRIEFELSVREPGHVIIFRACAQLMYNIICKRYRTLYTTLLLNLFTYLNICHVIKLYP